MTTSAGQTQQQGNCRTGLRSVFQKLQDRAFGWIHIPHRLHMRLIMRLHMRFRNSRQFRVHQQFDEEIRPGFVCGESRWRRTIFSHSRPPGRNPRAASLCQIQLLQKITDPAIAITTRDKPATIQGCHANRDIRAGITDNFDAIRADTDFDRLGLLITAVVKGIDDSLLNRSKNDRITAAGFQPALYSIRSPSTVRCHSRSSMLPGRSAMAAVLHFNCFPTRQTVFDFPKACTGCE